MMLDPQPSFDKACSLVMIEESQRLLSKSNATNAFGASTFGDMCEAMVLFMLKANSLRKKFGSLSVYSFRDKKSSNSHLHCDYCD